MPVSLLWPSISRPRLAFIHLWAATVGAAAALYGAYLNRQASPALGWKLLGAWLLASAGGALVLAAQVAGTRQASGRPGSHPLNLNTPLWPAQVVLSGLGYMSAGAALIHFAVIGEHLEEYWPFGVFFIAVSLFQMAWALIIVASPGRWMLLGGAAVNLFVVGAWVLSRTVGLPFGPEAGERITAGFGDTVSTAFEVLIVVFALLLWWSRQARPGVTVRATSILDLAVVAVTALGLISAVGGARFIPPSG